MSRSYLNKVSHKHNLSFNQIILVEIGFEASTVGELKHGIEKNEDFEDLENIEEWKLFWLGSLLENSELQLQDLSVGEGELKFNLVPPTEVPRVGDGKGHFISADKTRFLVVGSSKSFKVLALKPQKLDCATQFHKLPQEYFFFGKQKFGIITNMATNKRNIREIECEIYEVDEEGSIVLQTNAANEEAVVFLVKDTGERPYKAKKLKPREISKTYEENNLKNTGKGKIPEHFKLLLDEFEETI